MIKRIILLLACLSLAACGAVKTPISNHYQLTQYSKKAYKAQPRKRSILVTLPDAMAGYDTEQMLYVKKPYELSVFANNAWSSPPAEMLYPLIVESLQSSGYFYAVASSVYAQMTDYRVDTQLIRLQQNFMAKPSVLEMAVKVVVAKVEDNQVLGSRLFKVAIKTPQDSPLGGVVAANQATEQITGQITAFVIATLR